MAICHNSDNYHEQVIERARLRGIGICKKNWKFGTEYMNAITGSKNNLQFLVKGKICKSQVV